MGIRGEYQIAKKGALRIQTNPVCRFVRALASAFPTQPLVRHRDNDGAALNSNFQEKAIVLRTPLRCALAMRCLQAMAS